MAGLLDAQDALDPGDDLVGGGVDGLVQVDAAGLDVVLDGAVEGRGAVGQGCVVVGSDVEFVEVLEQERPVFRVEGGFFVRRFY